MKLLFLIHFQSFLMSLNKKNGFIFFKLKFLISLRVVVFALRFILYFFFKLQALLSFLPALYKITVKQSKELRVRTKLTISMANLKPISSTRALPKIGKTREIIPKKNVQVEETRCATQSSYSGNSFIPPVKASPKHNDLHIPLNAPTRNIPIPISRGELGR